MKKADALEYHKRSPAGKISIQPTKPCTTQDDLALAYTPGVAEPSLAIAKRPASVYNYTNKGNLVGIISNGTAVLGLGNIGAAASKPVMEGKSVLFKQFAKVDAFDLEVSTTNADEFITVVKNLAPTFGAINLEDISAPDCFYIEDQLQKQLDIPVFHDDQHGTAIISGAALLNAIELVNKDIRNIKVVISGAGAAGIRCAEHYVRLGVQKKHIWMCDSRGLITKDRKGLDKYKQQFANNVLRRDKSRLVRTGDKNVTHTLADALVNADVFLGVSVANILTPAMIKTMAPNPIVFALANPNPEIAYPLAKRTRHDILLASGRSDYPNQINNVLGFPFIMRGALDVQATCITEGMKIAATKALAKIAHYPVPRYILKAYNLKSLRFGPEYIVPKPFDKRVYVEVSAAVAQAAIQDGVARKKINIKRYIKNLQNTANQSR